MKATARPIAPCSLRHDARRQAHVSRRRTSIATVSGPVCANGRSVSSSAPPIDRFSVVQRDRAPAAAARWSRAGRGDAERLATLGEARALLRGRETRLVPVDTQLAGEQHASEGAVERQPGRAGGSAAPWTSSTTAPRSRRSTTATRLTGPATTLASWPTVGRNRLTSAMSAPGARGWLSLVAGPARHAASMNDTQQQRSALVFGARNLGRAVIERLRADGWAVAAVGPLGGHARRPRERRARWRMARRHHRSGERRAAPWREAAEAHGGVDLVVNAASAYGGDRSGPFGGGPIAEAAPDAFDSWAAAPARAAFAFLSVAGRFALDAGPPGDARSRSPAARRAARCPAAGCGPRAPSACARSPRPPRSSCASTASTSRC